VASWIPRSVVPGVGWPAVPGESDSAVLSLLWQLERTQWWSPDALASRQLEQATEVVRHAVDTTAHFARAIAFVPAPGTAMTPAMWSRVPIMTRQALIAAGDDLLSQRYPAAHGELHEVRTSGTTGRPVRVRASEVLVAFWRAMTVRDHLWHQRDPDSHLAAIRYAPGTAHPPDGIEGQGWGPATAMFSADAPLSLLSIASTTAEQAAWLAQRNPAYLLVFPTVLDQLLTHFSTTGERLPALREVRTVGEAMEPTLRDRCRAILGVPIVDTYSAEEVGYIALQCPEHPHYHIQAERLLVEVLADDGTPCEAGESGRVVLTDLHNFATPVIRYDIGDRAEVGPACPCGRGLPVLTRIFGRTRNMLVYPDGRTIFPVFTIACREAARFVEMQLLQETVDLLRLRIVPEAPLTDGDRQALRAALIRSFGHAFQVEVEVVAEIPRGPSGKREEFVSRVAAPDSTPPTPGRTRPPRTRD
jgi:phenylacetate-CoA ligase